MFILAVSGPLVIGVAILGAVLLLWVLLRAEARDAAAAEEPEEPQALSAHAQRTVTIQPSELRTIGGWMWVSAANRWGET